MALALVLKEKLPGMRIFRSLSMVSWVPPIIVMVILFRFMVQNGFGPANIVLDALGLETTYWFGDPEMAFPLIVLMHVWRNVPFYAIALMAAMNSIPRPSTRPRASTAPARSSAFATSRSRRSRTCR